MKNKGITLISLIVTIIIILVLSGILANIVMGDNGILVKAKIAKESTENSQKEEDIKLSDYNTRIDGYLGNSRGQITVDQAQYEQLLQDVSDLKAKVNSTNGGSFEKTLLGNTSSTSWTKFDVPGGISQYKYVYIVFGSAVEVYGTYTMYVDEFKTFNNSSNTFRMYFSTTSTGYYSYAYFGDENSLYLKVSAYATKIYGIK